MNTKIIRDLINKEKKDYFEAQYNSPFFRYEVKNMSNYFSEREHLFVFLPLTFISMILPGPILSLSIPTLPTLLIVLLYCFFVIMILITGSFLSAKAKEKSIIKKIEEDENERNEYLNYIIMPYFEKKLISDEILQHIKLNLTLDQFKILKAMNKDGITYKGLSDFLENIKDIDSSIKEAESEKYSLTHNDIKQYLYK